MGKKSGKKGGGGKAFPHTPEPSADIDRISHSGWMAIALGIGILAVGFWILSWTDRMGRNWAACVSPFVILGGYAVIGLGIFLPDRKPPLPTSKNPS
ncbi:MAG: hypothetical protein ACYCPQ_08940 [Elusimicrobiota bacterium]